MPVIRSFLCIRHALPLTACCSRGSGKINREAGRFAHRTDAAHLLCEETLTACSKLLAGPTRNVLLEESEIANSTTSPYLGLTMTSVSGFTLRYVLGQFGLDLDRGNRMNIVKIRASRAFVRGPASLLLLSLLSALPASSWADENARAEQPACGALPADPAAARPDSLIRALYDIVSGPAKSAKDWARLERLHAPGALITPTQHRNTVAFAAAPQALPTFIELNKRLFADRGFYEREIFHRAQRFGHIAHVWSGYEAREHPDGPIQARGVNSFQLLNDGQRWCVLSATWDTDTADHPMKADAAEDVK